jgi:hypothetical protein
MLLEQGENYLETSKPKNNGKLLPTKTIFTLPKVLSFYPCKWEKIKE